MNEDQNLSAALASSPSSLLSITVHWCFSPLLLYSSSPLLPRLVWGKRAACLHTSGQDWWLVNSISQHCRPHWCRTESIYPSEVLNICAPQTGVTISFISLNFTFLWQILFSCFLECFASLSLTFQLNYGLRFQKGNVTMECHVIFNDFYETSRWKLFFPHCSSVESIIQLQSVISWWKLHSFSILPAVMVFERFRRRTSLTSIPEVTWWDAAINFGL